MMSNCANNNNKYYIIQVLKEKASKRFLYYTRYGRVGEDGVSNMEPNSLEQAEKQYHSTYAKKTAASKGYMKVDMDMGVPGKSSVKTTIVKVEDTKYVKSSLDSKVQTFIKFIFDKDLMEKSVSQAGYDVKKLPLGQLSEETVKEGYSYLRQIEAILNQIKKGKFKLSAKKAELSTLSGKFYTFIPHDFGR